MKAAQEVGEPALGVGHDQMLMGGHERDGVHKDTKLTCANRKNVEVELSHGGVRAKEVVAAKSAPGDHDGAAGQDETGLGHAGRREQEPGHVVLT